MKRTAFAIAVVITAVALGCLPVKTSDDALLRDPSFHIMVNDAVPIPAAATYDFSTKVFKLDHPEEFDLAEIDRRIVEAIESELAGKRYRRTRSEPEVLVSFALAVDSAISASDLDREYAEDFPVDFPAMAPDQEQAYHRGALIVDFVDRGSRKLLWRGAISAGLDSGVDEDVKRRRTREAIRILLGHFPRPIQEGVASGSSVGP